ncbi:hypothetical protein RFF05_02445 [Bengtsoniella intestinalis]|uniref:hypothetical protein n=1 Tax=Bengtsoniella intestinalis TaxID=3073143 RepID=UPI00391F634A
MVLAAGVVTTAVAVVVAVMITGAAALVATPATTATAGNQNDDNDQPQARTVSRVKAHIHSPHFVEVYVQNSKTGLDP